MNLCQYIIDASGIQEVALRNIIMLTVQDLTESTDGLADRYIFSFQTCPSVVLNSTISTIPS
jgi:hypothetical protein